MGLCRHSPPDEAVSELKHQEPAQIYLSQLSNKIMFAVSFAEAANILFCCLQYQRIA